MIPPPDWIPSNPEYHATTSHWSSSMLKTFRAAPALAEGMYVTRKIERDKPTPSMVIGSAVNVILLEPHRMKTYVYVAECKSRTAKEYKSAAALRPDQLVLTQAEWEEAEAIANSILQPKTRMAEIAHRLLAGPGGYSEYVIRWDDPLGVPCKLMVDRLREVSDQPAIGELKTCFDPTPEEFSSHFYNMEYHAQAAFNRRGVQRFLGVLPRFYVIAVRNEIPYDVWVYQLDEDLLADGMTQVTSDLEAISKCLSGEQPWHRPGEMQVDSIPVLRAPRWARKNQQSDPYVIDTY